MRNSEPIEQQLGKALRLIETPLDHFAEPTQTGTHLEDLDAQSLFQLAYDQAVAEQEALQKELRALETEYNNRKRQLKIEIAKRRALAQEIAGHMASGESD